MVLGLSIISLKYAVARTGHDLDTSACTSGCAPISTAGSSTKESVIAVSGHFEVHVHPDIYIQIVWCPDVSHEKNTCFKWSALTFIKMAGIDTY